ncbi:endonuclease/exonuclease/phosphatase family protein [Aquimarina sp. TRL1]|uniref:endonuclease/exonuclease/phosphatase family protein n=1 Tax=Aquimarina sp. (strain TRL1) TaxID=2736252 RepID=UPI00158835D3|nr:endonuclease/exonuclease/phosphatase family protein [Aquimarina sp. TRL1]QKX07455.1 endonuclease/exonuclease/phosphatase family protein [Aquimarina sp. TRL1]
MSELNILYWNTYQKPLIDEIKNMVISHNINFIVLIENTADDDFLLNSLKNINPDFRKFKTRIFNRPKIFSSFQEIEIKEVSGHGRYGIYEILLPKYQKKLLSITHFPSKLNWGNPNDHFGLCVELKTDIELQEFKSETRNTIILGDFNMNPFEDGLVNATGLHNISNKEIALTMDRNYQGRSYNYFYNPMWSFLGDESKGDVQGTHFYNSYKPINYFWNLFDQVMIRPELIPFFEEDELKIITKINNTPLLKKVNGYKRIDKNYSDHLPIKFQVKLIKQEEYEQQELMAK